MTDISATEYVYLYDYSNEKITNTNSNRPKNKMNDKIQFYYLRIEDVHIPNCELYYDTVIVTCYINAQETSQRNFLYK